MRQKFEAEQPDEMDRNNQSMDRSQGAARAISVRITTLLTNYVS
jgi:L-lactate dehydrogenase (cytochrome)